MRSLCERRERLDEQVLVWVAAAADDEDDVVFEVEVAAEVFVEVLVGLTELDEEALMLVAEADSDEEETASEGDAPALAAPAPASEEPEPGLAAAAADPVSLPVS